MSIYRNVSEMTESLLQDQILMNRELKARYKYGANETGRTYYTNILHFRYLPGRLDQP